MAQESNPSLDALNVESSRVVANTQQETPQVFPGSAEDQATLLHELQQRESEAVECIVQQNEELLPDSQEQWRCLVENAADIIMRVSRDGVIEFINRAAPELEPATLIGTRVYEYVPREQHRQVKEAIERVFQTGAPASFEANGIGPNCSTSWRSMRLGPVKRDGETVAVTMISTDITQRKIREAQLLQAQKMESIGRVSGGIAHDFNNILAGILGFASLLRVRLDPHSELRQYAQGIENAAQRGAQLTQQLLAAGRLGPFEPTPMQVNHSALEVTQLLARRIPREINISAQLDHGLPLIEGDAAQIQQALLNLGLNAADAMPEGGNLTISTGVTHLDEEFCRQHLGLQSGDFVTVTVTDSGSGIKEEDLPRIFEPFFTTKAVGKGAGLGLSVAYGVMQNHQGAISVSSEWGQGASFTVYFPLIANCETVNVDKPASPQ